MRLSILIFCFFQDGRSVSQAEEVIVVPGEDVIIPCRYPLEILGEALQVDWYSGYSEHCTFNKNRIYTGNKTSDRCSIVNFPEDVSLRMRNVSRHDFPRYCCHVTTSSGIIKSKHGTELTFSDSLTFPPIKITQAQKMVGRIGEFLILNCSYKLSEEDVLWVNTYWRLGNKTGPYVYHPYKEMVHPNYRGRTEITGPADLHIRGVQMSDDSTYYCFVVFRLCRGHDIYKKSVTFGEGTKLSMTESIIKQPDERSKQRLLITVSISTSMLLIILCVTLGVLKKADVICKKKNAPRKTSDNPENEHNPAAECEEEAK